MARDTWYRLDNVGKFYSSQAHSPFQTVFRYAATLVDDVDEALLQQALDRTVDVFPGFNVCLRSGMFWHYLEQAPQAPAVVHENLPICYGLHVHARSVLFRVSYHRERINFEVSHIVSDGRGALSFFKALLYAYIQRRYGVQGVSPEYDGSDHQKSEDSFNKYFERDKAAATRAPKVYRLSGWHDRADPTFLEYHLPAGQVLDLARSFKVSLTSLLLAMVVCAIRLEMRQRDRQHAIRIDVPVDLRSFFDSATTKNFFGLAYVSYTPGNAEESLEELAVQMHAQLKAGVQVENLKPRMNRMIALEKHPVLRFAPLFVKDLVLEVVDRRVARETTTTVSNLGSIAIDGRMAPYLRDLNILTSTNGINFMACSFGDDLSIGITTAYSNHNVIKNFCRSFSSRGIEGVVHINKTSEEVAEDRREARIESSVKRLGDKLPARAGGAADAGSSSSGSSAGAAGVSGAAAGGPADAGSSSGASTEEDADGAGAADGADAVLGKGAPR